MIVVNILRPLIVEENMKIEEKIKIYVSKRTKEILDKDAELFEFFKKNGEINRNEFLNTLIMNYSSYYEEEINKLTNNIKKDLASIITSHNDLEYLSNKLSHMINQKGSKTELDNYSEVLSLKPTKASQDTIIYIQNTALSTTTLSNYFRDMFISYTSKTQDEREKIIFKDIYNDVLSAIEKGNTISIITTKKPTKVQLVLPWKLASAKEELFNYLLAEYNNRPLTYRLSRIKKVIINNEKAIFNKDVIKSLELMNEYGPQYIINTPEEICVYLSNKGLEMFDLFYVHRPTPYKKEGHYYYFKCSKIQIELYFRRFGYHAHIITPTSLEESMKSFYENSAYEYKKDKSPKKTETRTFKKGS